MHHYAARYYPRRWLDEDNVYVAGAGRSLRAFRERVRQLLKS